MMILVFDVASQAYAVESRRVVEVLPLVPVRPIPQAPPSVRGAFTYRGRLLPVVDLSRLIVGIAPRERLGTRVIVTSSTTADGHIREFGLVAENVLSIRETTGTRASLSMTPPTTAAYLGELIHIDGITVQLLDVAHLLPVVLPTGVFSYETGSSPVPDGSEVTPADERRPGRLR